MLGKDADVRSQIHKFEHDLLELTETSSKMCKFLQNKQYNIAEHVLTELNQLLQRKPDNPDQPLSVRRLNWVEQNREQQKLMARLSKIKHMIKVVKQAMDNISGITMLDQGTSAAGVSSSDGYDKKRASSTELSFLGHFVSSLSDSATCTRRLLIPWIGWPLLLHQLLVIIHCTFRFLVSTICPAHNAAWPKKSDSNTALALSRNNGVIF